MSQRIDDTNFRDNPVLWTEERLFAVFGFRRPIDQMVYSFLMSILAYVLTILSAGATIALILIFTGTFLIGAIRMLYGVIAA